MECKSAKHHMSALIDGELDFQSREKLQNHLSSCKVCREAFEELSKTWEMLGTVSPPGPAPYLYTRVRARLDAEESMPHAGFWKRFAVPLASAAVVALGVFFGSQIVLSEHNYTARTADEYFGSLYLDAFQDFPTASLGAVYFADASAGGEE